MGGGAGAEVTPEARGAAAEGTGLATELRVAVDRLEELVGVEDRVRQVWLAPLPPALSLDEVVDPDKEEDRSPVDPGWLEVVVGLKDRPRDQLQEPLALRFTGRGGHYAVVGAPRSGKSTLLQGLVGSLALGHDPRDVHVYVVDLGGGLMHALEDAPHVGAVYGRSERAEINRLVRELRAVIDSRVELFRQHRLANMSEFHAKRLSGEIEDEYGEVLLIVDNWALFAQEFEDLQQPLIDMAGTSLHYGVHLVITSNRWLDMRMNLRDNIGGRIELRLNDPLDSEIDRRVAKTLPDLPGRGLSPEAEHFQAALPRIDGRGDVGGLNAAIHALLRVVGERWNESPAAPPIKMLPFELRAGDLPPGIDERHPGILVGLEEFRLEPVWVDLLDRHQHLVVYGDGQCGKTNLLKVVFEGVRGRFGPKEMRVAIVDYRRSLAGAVAGAEHVAAYTYTSDMATQLAGEMMVELRKRMPSAQVGLSAPTMPTAWKGPHVLLLVDDYDLVASPAGNPLGELVEALPQARDIGFHVVLSRRVSGTARGSFEPLYQRLVELGAPGLLMNGDPGEGPILAGEKAQPLPPGRGYLVADRRS
ncbi:MAG: type VII secretion protein EccCb, partial [Actinomycetota bacterium]